MRILPNTTGPQSNSSFSGEDEYSGEASWEEDSAGSIDIDKLSNIINNKIKLSQIFNKYNIFFDFKYSTSGWNNVCHCPFPDHHDVNASFGYNDSIDRFNCFGCSRSGGSVQFIAAKEGLSKIQSIKYILSEFNDLISDSEDKKIFNFNYEDIDKKKKLIYDFYKDIRILRKQFILNKKYIKLLDNVLWSIDIFFMKHSDIRFINLEDLEARMNIIKQKLNKFIELDNE